MSAPQTTSVNPELIELALRLESIFMPQARKQRAVLYADRPNNLPPPRFVHYTSAENALNIIRTKRLWMRNATCMQDYREVHHGFEILAKFFSDKPRLDAFTSALDQCATGAAIEAINLFNGWWNDIRDHTYVSSISEHVATEDHHGRLSMWRAFGNSSARVGLVFRVPSYSGGALALNLMFSPVAYLGETDVHGIIFDVIKNIDENRDFLRTVDRQVVINNVFAMLLAGVTCLKHEGFGEEREWRAIYSPNRLPSHLMETSTEVVAGVPQVVCKIPLDANVSPVLAELDFAAMFDRLIIGPSQYPLAMKEAFKIALSAAGVADTGNKIFASLIPIRT
jgi:hypothetical protein